MEQNQQQAIKQKQNQNRNIITSREKTDKPNKVIYIYSYKYHDYNKFNLNCIYKTWNVIEAQMNDSNNEHLYGSEATY